VKCNLKQSKVGVTHNDPLPTVKTISLVSSAGPLLGFPVLCDITVSDVVLGPATSLAMLASCLSESVASALKKGGVQLLEPCTSLEVTVPEEHVGRVLADLSAQRRAQIQEVGQGKQGTEKVVTAISPLAGLMVCVGTDGPAIAVKISI
jgi:elongation factor G